MGKPTKQYPSIEGISDPFLIALAHEANGLDYAVELLGRETTAIWESIEDGATPEEAVKQHPMDLWRARAVLALARQCIDQYEQLITF